MKKYVFLVFILSLIVLSGCKARPKQIVENWKEEFIKEREPASEFVEPAPSKIVQDPDTGIEMVKDELLIGFLEDVTEDERLEIIKNAGGTIIAIDRDFDEYQVKFSVTDVKDLYKIEEQLEQNPKVEFASPAYFEEAI